MPLRLLLLENQVGISGEGIIRSIDGDSRAVNKEFPLSSLLGWKSGFHPSLLSLRIMRHVDINLRRERLNGNVLCSLRHKWFEQGFEARTQAQFFSFLLKQLLRISRCL
jgi:hypothetical protein